MTILWDAICNLHVLYWLIFLNINNANFLQVPTIKNLVIFVHIFNSVSMFANMIIVFHYSRNFNLNERRSIGIRVA